MLWIIFPMKYSQDNCVDVLWTEIFKAMVNTVHDKILLETKK